MPEWLSKILQIGTGSGLILLALNAFGWIRFKKKDDADVRKILSETQVDLADATNKKIDDEVKISKAALEWTVQLAGQLEKANILNDKRQLENDGLRAVIQQMKVDFETRIKEVEDMLEVNQNELTAEKQKNRDLLSQLNQFIHGTGK